MSNNVRTTTITQKQCMNYKLNMKDTNKLLARQIQIL